MEFISSYCQINNKECKVNGEIIASSSSKQEEGWIKSLYQSLDLKYPKFHKMDLLSQVAFLGTEFLLKETPSIQNYADDEIALVFSNRTSSLHTDLNYQNSYQNEGSPSPSLFVYTLPNILLGEISIKNKWYGENVFTVLPKFNPSFFINYSKVLLNEQTKACLCGWVEVNEDQIEAFLFFIEKQEAKPLNLPLSENNIEQLYNEHNG